MLTVGRCWRDAPLAPLPHAVVQACTILLYTAPYAQPNHGLGKLAMHGSIMLGHAAAAAAMVCLGRGLSLDSSTRSSSYMQKL